MVIVIVEEKYSSYLGQLPTMYGATLIVRCRIQVGDCGTLDRGKSRGNQELEFLRHGSAADAHAFKWNRGEKYLEAGILMLRIGWILR